MENKKEIRKTAKQRRSRMEIAEVAGKSEGICRKLIDNARIQQSDMIFVYAAKGNEVNLQLFVEQMWQMGKRVAFPCCMGDRMEFYEVTDWSQLVEGSFGILEPQNMSLPVIPSETTVVCVPGVAFTSSGDRIGMGKGYYDRYLKRYPCLYKIGLAFELQVEYSWVPEYSDITMNLLITEQREVCINERKRIM